MSFLGKYRRNLKPIQNIKVSLQTRKEIHPNCIPAKRTSRGISFSCIKKASLTVEAALVLPIFLFAVLQLLSILDLYRFQVNMETALHQTARELAVYGYASEELTKDSAFGSLMDSTLGQLAFSESYVRRDVFSQLEAENWNQAPVKGGKSGISFLQSKIMEEDRISLVASYVPQLYFSNKLQYKYCQARCTIRAFTGYDNTKGNFAVGQEEMVFITERGQVYHKDRGCSALNVSVSSVSRGEVSLKRNYDGGKYYPCPYCGKKAAGNVYITNYGNRYHGSITCSELKRSVMAVPLSQVGERLPCKKCS